MYVQDFDIVFECDTDPIDLFCQQHTIEEQRQLLQDMRKLCDDLIHGRATLRTITSLGLEYVPEGNRALPQTWLTRFSDYLEAKIEVRP
jgi:hypothetical protein